MPAYATLTTQVTAGISALDSVLSLTLPVHGRAVPGNCFNLTIAKTIVSGPGNLGFQVNAIYDTDHKIRACSFNQVPSQVVTALNIYTPTIGLQVTVVSGPSECTFSMLAI